MSWEYFNTSTKDRVCTRERLIKAEVLFDKNIDVYFKTISEWKLRYNRGGFVYMYPPSLQDNLMNVLVKRFSASKKKKI